MVYSGKIIVFVYLCMAACAAAASSIGSTARTLLADKSVQGCHWEHMQCVANPQYALSLTASDDKARLAQKIAAMDYTCGTHTTNTTCEDDVVNQCAWYRTSQLSDTGSCRWMPGNWYPVLTCPNSKANQVVMCSLGGESETNCKKLSGCTWKVPTAEELAKLMATAVTTAVAAASKSIDQNQTASGANTSMVLASDDSDSNKLEVEGVCMPSTMTLESYFKDVMSAVESDKGTDFDDVANWGTCEGLNLLKALETTCANKTQATCNETSWCKPLVGGPQMDQFQTCHFMSEDQLRYIMTSAGGEFDTKMEAINTACAAATNETQCTAAAAANIVKFDEAKVTAALEFFKSGAGITAAALHLMLAAVAAGVLLMA